MDPLDKNPFPQISPRLMTGIRLASGLLLSACATSPTSATNRADETVERETLRVTAFLPYPGRPGIRHSLPPNAPLDLVRKGWGYSMVRTEDGRLGEVPTEDIGPRTNRPRFKSTTTGEWLPAKPTSFVTREAPPPGSQDRPVELQPTQPTASDAINIPPVEPDLPSWDDAPGEM